jgi:hypothetical protein
VRDVLAVVAIASLVACIAVLAAIFAGFHEWLVLGALIVLMLLAGMVNGWNGVNRIALGRVSERHLWLARAGKAFRDSLPDAGSPA